VLVAVGCVTLLPITWPLLCIPLPRSHLLARWLAHAQHLPRTADPSDLATFLVIFTRLLLRFSARICH
jgi:hypothetical protein